MIMYAYSVHDKAANAFLPLFFARAKGEAIRSFVSAVSDANHQFAKSKGDYTLYACGSFDDASGVLSPQEPDRVLSALEVLVE
jgi:hypothetical protein